MSRPKPSERIGRNGKKNLGLLGKSCSVRSSDAPRYCSRPTKGWISFSWDERVTLVFHKSPVFSFWIHLPSPAHVGRRGIMFHPYAFFRMNLSKSAFQKWQTSGSPPWIFSTAPKKPNPTLTSQTVSLSLPYFLCLCTSHCHTCLFLPLLINV